MHEAIHRIASGICKSAVTIDTQTRPPALLIAPEDLTALCHELFTHPETYFDMLSCITCMDNGPEDGTMEIAYNLYAIPYHVQLVLKIKVTRDAPRVPSLTDIWKSANWMEREIFDMFGVYFDGHPDLRRILMPADWEGFPLRKDYRHQDEYRGIKVEY